MGGELTLKIQRRWDYCKERDKRYDKYFAYLPAEIGRQYYGKKIKVKLIGVVED